jgi:hypothetical protein
MLEATLEAMDRVDAFIMLRNHRSPGNVFEEAARCVGWVAGGRECVCVGGVQQAGVVQW